MFRLNYNIYFCYNIIYIFSPTGSRFKTTADFGFVTLDLTEVYDRDQGVYTCRAWNLAGETFTSTTIYCSTKESLIERTQHPKGEEGLEKIQDLEESLRRVPPGAPEAEDGRPPQFTSEVSCPLCLIQGRLYFTAQTLIVFVMNSYCKATHVENYLS